MTKAPLVAALLLAGCGGLTQPSAAPAGFAQNATLGRDATLTMPHYVQRPVHPDRGASWMSPSAKTDKMLLYVGDWSTNDVYVYDYKTGASVGALTGNDEPYGMCVDATGNVYVADFGSGRLVEYAHGGTTPLQTYRPGGELIGCAVDASRDVAVTSFSGGAVTVYLKGNPKDGTTYSAASSCGYLWTMGYDDKGNLIGTDGRNSVCGLLAGSKSLKQLKMAGFTIGYPGGTTWDGKYIAVGDQEVGGSSQTGVVRATLEGRTLKYVSSTIFASSCDGGYSDIVNPFIVGKKNTPLNRKQGSAMVGPNLWCGGVDYWHYPAGGLPYGDLSSPPSEPYSASVSIAP